MTEAEIQNAIFLEFGREPDVTLWRNNTGQAKAEVATRAHLERMLGWVVAATQQPTKATTFVVQTRDLIRSLLTERQRYTRYGLMKGSSDIIGIVQSDHLRPGVGGFHPYGIFLALEVKTDTGRVSTEQQMFLEVVNRRGGVGRVVRSVDDARKAIDEARRL